ncbi:MAG: hypothetical protein V4723_14860 [Pseudomonadota bacterium]
MNIFSRPVLKSDRGIRIFLVVLLTLTLGILLMSNSYDLGYKLGQSLYHLTH